ncbi:MAG: zinc-dependent peptidase, partial [Ignavibacteriaceae bacterium]|nr:zinc-dependent peptidase [Ignavibacteriaceae bacterium]
MFGFRKRKREKLRATELKSEWKEIINRNVRFYNYLSDDLKTELHGLIQIFLNEKIFEGCEG